MLIRNGTPSLVEKFITLVASALAWALYAFGTVVSLPLYLSPRTRFLMEFGFIPSRMETSIRTLTSEQIRVNSHLEDLAISLAFALRMEENAKSDCSIQSNQLGRNVRAAKRCFWRAHTLAKLNGFLVREKYTDYYSGPRT